MKKYFSVILGSIIIGLSYSIFFYPYGLISSGAFGLATIFNYSFPINPGIVVLIINLIGLFMSISIFGYKKTKNYFIPGLLIPIIIYLSININKIIDLTNIDTIIICISGAFLTGIGYSFIHKEGYHVGGIDLIENIYNKYQKNKTKLFSYFVEAIILIITIILFGYEKCVYSAIIILIINYMSTKTKIGISSSKTFFIITTKEDDIKSYLLNELKTDFTEFNVKGGYSSDKTKIIMTVIDTKDYYKFKEGVHLIDEKAFIAIIDTYETINKNITINKELKK